MLSSFSCVDRLLLFYEASIFLPGFGWSILFMWPGRSRLRHTGSSSFVEARGTFSCSTQTLWDLVPRTGIEPRPLHWKPGVLVA